MFYGAHFIIDVTNWSRGIWLDGTMQITDREDILLSDRFVPAYLQEFPDDRCSANEALASMVGVAKVYDRILTLADEHGLYVDEDEFSTLTVSSGGPTIGTMMVAVRRSGAELDIDPFCGEDVSKRPIWDHFVDDLIRDPVIKHSRTPVEAATQWRPAKLLTHSTRFHVYTKPVGEMMFVSGEVALTVDNVETFSWGTNVGMTCSENIVGKVQEVFERLVVGASVMESLALVVDACGITLVMAAVDAWWRKTVTVGETTKVGARWIHKRIKLREVKEESSRLVDDFILCLEEMRGSDRYSATWECARSDARDRLTDLCDLVGVPAEEVIGSDI